MSVLISHKKKRKITLSRLMESLFGRTPLKPARSSTVSLFLRADVSPGIVPQGEGRRSSLFFTSTGSGHPTYVSKHGSIEKGGRSYPRSVRGCGEKSGRGGNLA